MSIISLQFLYFVLIAVFIYHLLPRPVKSYWLIFVSAVFYILIDFSAFLLAALILGGNFWLTALFFKSEKKNRYFRMAIAFNILAFGALKLITSRYAGLLLPLNNPGDQGWLLPIGFSFYILQFISFQIEIRKGRIAVLPAFKDFALFILYFPKLLSGPIEKPGDFLNQLASPKLVDNEMISKGFGLIFAGLLRKLVIANLLFMVMPDWNLQTNSIGWAAVIGYVLYVYNDFAGYTAIVRGISCFFGIELTQNFQQPFLSRNLSEFWNRWHNSLSTWLRETIFFPLSRKFGRNSGNFLASAAAICIPPLLTMLASGFWHGASLAMVLWGGLQGIYLILERLVYLRFPNFRPQSLSRIGQFLSGIVVFLLFSFSMVPFAVNTVKPALAVWGNLFSAAGFAYGDATLQVLVLGGISFLFDYLSNKSGSELWWKDFHPFAKSMVLATGFVVMFILIKILTANDLRVFVYQGF